jgi:hypothetical protein
MAPCQCNEHAGARLSSSGYGRRFASWRGRRFPESEACDARTRKRAKLAVYKQPDRSRSVSSLPSAAARIALAARTPFSSPPLQPSPLRSWRCVTIPPEKRQKQRFCGRACDAHADARRSRHGSEPVATRTRLAEDAPAAHDSREAQTTLARRTRFAPASHGTRTRPAPPAHRTRTRRAQTETARQIEYDKSDVSS